MKIKEILEVNMNSKTGAGAVSNNDEVDYFGIRVKMKPTTFLKLAEEMPIDSEVKQQILKLAQYIKDGGEIGQPFFGIHIPEKWHSGDFREPAEITNHEGRHRMEAIILAEGDNPVEVHLFPQYYRNRHITPEWIKRLNKSIISETGQLISGPLFTI